MPSTTLDPTTAATTTETPKPIIAAPTNTTPSQPATTSDTPAQTTEPQQSDSTSADSAANVSAEVNNALNNKQKVSFSDIQARMQGVVKEDVKAKVEEQGKKIEADDKTTTAVVTDTTKKPLDSAAAQQQKQQQDLAQRANTRASVLKELGIPEADYKKYQSMSNEGFELVKNTIVEVKTLKSKLTELEKAKTTNTQTAPPDSYSHPQGYLLDSRYTQAQAIATKASAVEKHWETQLANIQAGEDWSPLELDEKTGEIYVGPPQKATPQALSLVAKQHRSAVDANYNYSRQAQQIQQQYQQIHQQDVGKMKALADEFFPNYDNPEHENYKKTIDVRNQAKNLLPESWRSHPLVDGWAKTVANNSLLFNSNQALINENAQLKSRIAELEKTAPAGVVTKQQQPTGDSFVAATGGNGKKTFNYQAFQNRMQGVS